MASEWIATIRNPHMEIWFYLNGFHNGVTLDNLKKKVMQLYGIPKDIIFDRESMF